MIAQIISDLNEYDRIGATSMEQLWNHQSTRNRQLSLLIHDMFTSLSEDAKYLFAFRITQQGLEGFIDDDHLKTIEKYFHNDIVGVDATHPAYIECNLEIQDCFGVITKETAF